MDPAGLHTLQLELECKAVREDGRLVRIPGDEPDDLEFVQLTRDAAGTHRILVSADAPDELAESVRQLSPKAAFEDPGVVATLLSEPKTTWSRGLSYIFPDELVRPAGVARLMPEVDQPAAMEPWMHRPMFVVFADGQKACHCRSSRENHRAAEAWVETVPRYRRLGFARRAAAAWACSVRESGKVPFYSHDEDNLPSAGVARSLGLQHSLTWVNFETTTT